MTPSDPSTRRPAPPTDLREALLDAAARQSWEDLAALCERHQEAIREAFTGWQQVPEGVGRDREAQARYAGGLIAVAQMFEQAGDGSLIARLMGHAAEDPLAAWERALATAQSLLEQGQSQEAADLLSATLERHRALEGAAAISCQARTLGMRGVALFRAGDAHAGIAATRRARELCEGAGDEAGAAVYGGNLQRMEASAAAQGAGTAASPAPPTSGR